MGQHQPTPVDKKQERYRRKLGQQPRYADPATSTLVIPPVHRLTTKQERFAEAIAKGLSRQEAAQQAGYRNGATADKAIKNPLFQQYVSAMRAETRAIANYDLATAMDEALQVIVFAKEHKNAMAFCKAVELRAKLSGLLVDKVEVISVDLTKALAMAEARVFSIPALKQSVEAETEAPANLIA